MQCQNNCKCDSVKSQYQLVGNIAFAAAGSCALASLVHNVNAKRLTFRSRHIAFA